MSDRLKRLEKLDSTRLVEEVEKGVSIAKLGKTKSVLNPETVVRENSEISGVIHEALRREAVIEAKHKALGGNAKWGVPTEKDLGRAWYFRNSAIVFNSEKNAAFEIHGSIFARWQEAGRLKFGIPNTDERPASDNVGRYNDFNNGTKSIYWSPSTGAHTIHGNIRKRWVELGKERSYLGYPTSDEVAFDEGGRASDFQNGGIYWWPDTGAIDLRDVVVHYTGLHCFGETSWDQGSDSDEPYVIFALSTPTNAWGVTSRIYQDVDAKEQRPDLLELYRGRPYGLNIGIVLMEHDFGDPNKYRKEIVDTVMAAHAVGVAALGLIPIAGPAVAAIAGPALGALMPGLGGAISDAFDWGDDRIGSTTLTLGARELVLLAARTNNSTFGNIGYKRESALISGLGASYKVYIGVVPA